MARCPHKGPERLRDLFPRPVFLDANRLQRSVWRELTVTALLPVVSRQTVVTLGPRGAIFALAETRSVTPVMDRAHLVAVALCRKRMVEKKDTIVALCVVFFFFIRYGGILYKKWIVCSIKDLLQHRTREGGFLKSTQRTSKLCWNLRIKKLSLKVYFVF